MEFTDHYQIFGEIHPTRDSALKAANQEADRVWFVRHGDGSCDCDLDPEEDSDEHMCDFEETWDVVLDAGQYVNCAGFLVSVEHCKPEHHDTIFTY